MWRKASLMRRYCVAIIMDLYLNLRRTVLGPFRWRISWIIFMNWSSLGFPQVRIVQSYLGKFEVDESRFLQANLLFMRGKRCISEIIELRYHVLRKLREKHFWAFGFEWQMTLTTILFSFLPFANAQIVCYSGGPDVYSQNGIFFPENLKTFASKTFLN